MACIIAINIGKTLASISTTSYLFFSLKESIADNSFVVVVVRLTQELREKWGYQ